MKTCSKCGLSKEEKEFYKNRSQRDQLTSWCKTCTISYRRLVKLNYPERILLYDAKCRAKRKALEFNITIEDIVIPSVCPIMNIPLYSRTGLYNNGIDNSPSLDRIDNTKGYIKGNVAVVSARANKLKRDITVEQAERLIKYMKGELNVN